MGLGITYKITAQGSASGDGLTLSDPFLRLVNGSQTVIAFDDDNGGPLDSLIVFTRKTTAVYYFDTSAFSTGTGVYRLQVAQNDNLFEGAAETVFWNMNSDGLPSNQKLTASLFALDQFTFGEQIGVLDPTVYIYE